MSKIHSSTLLALLATAGVAIAQDDVPNSIEFSLGGSVVNGDEANAQAKTHQSKDITGGISDLHFSTTDSKNNSATIDARAMVDEDYFLDAKVSFGNDFYVRGGYEQNRYYYDGSGGVHFPSSTEGTLNYGTYSFDPELHLDRTSYWAEIGFVPADGVNLVLNYKHQDRKGTKNSTSWGEANPGGTTRYITPALNSIDEKRDTVTLTASRTTDVMGWQLGGTYDHTELNNARLGRRGTNAANTRYLTSRDQTESNSATAHGSYHRQINEKLSFNTGAIFMTFDSNLGGSRIYGAPYADTFNAAVPGLGSHDEGFINLGGGSEIRQAVGNINMSWHGDNNLSLIGAVRLANEETDSAAHFIETTSTAYDSILNTSSRDWTEVTESIEARYQGFRDISLNAKAMLSQGQGTLDEMENDITGGSITATSLDQDRLLQKYSASAHWYASSAFTVSTQYYFKKTDNDNSAVTGTDYIVNQNRTVHDANIRVKYRATDKITFVTRYDYQIAMIDSRMLNLASAESARIESQIIGESVTWLPMNRLYVTGSVNAAFGELHTNITGVPAVADSNNDYLTANLAAGYALSDKSDLLLDYTYYKADNFINNSASAVTYGLDEISNNVSLTWTVRPTDKVTCSLRYAFASYDEDATRGYNDFVAQSIYAKVKYEF